MKMMTRTKKNNYLRVRLERFFLLITVNGHFEFGIFLLHLIHLYYNPPVTVKCLGKEISLIFPDHDS